VPRSAAMPSLPRDELREAASLFARSCFGPRASAGSWPGEPQRARRRACRGLPTSAPPSRRQDSKTQLFAGLSKPERGLEPLTYRLQGDSADRLNTPVLPANRGVSQSGQSVNFGSFRLIWAGLGPTGAPVGLNDLRSPAACALARARRTGRDPAASRDARNSSARVWQAAAQALPRRMLASATRNEQR
jgi:hypothetical protein